MVTSWIDLLSPEAVRILQYVAWGMLLVAITLWTLGVVIARVGVAVIAGSIAASLAALLAQHYGHQTVLAAAGVGFAAGALVGALGFKAVQAFALAVVLGAAVAGLYYHWHVAEISSPPPPSPASIAAVVSTQRSIAELQIPLERLQAQRPMSFDSLAQRIRDQFLGTSGAHMRRMAVAGIGSAVVALLFAFGFPRLTTAIITSVVGAAMLLAAARVLVQIRSPAQAGLFPHQAWSRYCVLVIMAGVGLLIQYRIFLRPPDKAQKIEASQKAHA